MHISIHPGLIIWGHHYLVNYNIILSNAKVWNRYWWHKVLVSITENELVHFQSPSGCFKS